MKRVGNASKDSVARVLAPVIEVLRVVFKRRGHFSWVTVPISGGQSESGGGEHAHRSVLTFAFKGVMLSCKVERERRLIKVRGKALRGRHDGIMDSSKSGVMKCCVEDVKRSGMSMPLHFPVTSKMQATFDVHILGSIRGGVVVVGDCLFGEGIGVDGYFKYCWFDLVDVHYPEITAACSYDTGLWD